MTVPSTPISDEELLELMNPDVEEAIDEIEIDDDDDDYPEVEETEVTEENFQDFLPQQEEGHDITLDEDGKLSADEQALYEEDPPEAQDGFEEGDGM